VIHAVGPRYRDGEHGEPEHLAGCYRNSLELAVARKLKTIAFPAISCGIYGYPIPEAARIAVESVSEFLEGDQTLEKIIFACFGSEVLDAFQTAASLTSPGDLRSGRRR
jgi:O-acetyl-ADP-ribose deacetylase